MHSVVCLRNLNHLPKLEFHMSGGSHGGEDNSLRTFENCMFWKDFPFGRVSCLTLLLWLQRDGRSPTLGKHSFAVSVVAYTFKALVFNSALNGQRNLVKLDTAGPLYLPEKLPAWDLFFSMLFPSLIPQFFQGFLEVSVLRLGRLGQALCQSA